MYSVSDLSKMYSTSRQTIYVKLTDARLTEFIEVTDKGKRLKQEGLSMFNLVMSSCKLDSKLDSQLDNKLDSQLDNFTPKNGKYFDKIFEKFINQIEQENLYLKKQIETLQNEKIELKNKYDNLVNIFIEQQMAKKYLPSKKNNGIFGWFRFGDRVDAEHQ